MAAGNDRQFWRKVARGSGVSETAQTVGLVPRLPRGVRLKFDETRGEWLLLAPERVVKVDSIAVAILQRCDGAATIESIVEDLAVTYAADRARIDADVRGLLNGLAAKRMVDL
jgi:pyrroloquinoline quinone biosynthesis protein D